MATGILAGLMSMVAPSAMADSGQVSNGFGRTVFDDSGDSYMVCGDSSDGMSAVGRIAVKQADGSWKNFDWRYDSDGPGDGDGNGVDCGHNNVDIIREAADVRLQICRQNLSAGGGIRDCAYRTISG